MLSLAAFALLLCFGAWAQWHFIVDWVPDVVPDDAPLDVFSEGRARARLAELARVSPCSWAGTVANAAAATEIERVARSVAATADALRAHDAMVPHVDVDVQRVSATTPFDILGGHMTNVFSNLTNVVVRVRFGAAGDDGQWPALLVNSHYDTPLGSNGAVDARTPISAMLETLRALVHSDADTLRRATAARTAIVFLFNGGEEVLQMASMGFIDQHRWAKSLRGVLNLDAVGVRGAAVLFQNGGIKWLREFQASVPRPYGTSIAADLFRSGIVQSDTDYRVFVKDADIVG